MVIVIKDILTELSPVHSPPPLHQASVFCWNPVAYYKWLPFRLQMIIIYIMICCVLQIIIIDLNTSNNYHGTQYDTVRWPHGTFKMWVEVNIIVRDFFQHFFLHNFYERSPMSIIVRDLYQHPWFFLQPTSFSGHQDSSFHSWSKSWP